MDNLSNKAVLTLLSLFLWSELLHAQINGTVSDEYGASLQGVIITAANGKNATATDQHGHYEMRIDDNSTHLIFALAGYVSQTHPVSSEVLDITLKRAETYDLDEKIYFGNYVQRKGGSTASTSSVSGD